MKSLNNGNFEGKIFIVFYFQIWLFCKMENELFDFLANYMPLTDAEKQVIVDMKLVKKLKKGTVILSEGQTSSESFFVLKGCIRSYYVVDGEEKTTDILVEMEVLTPVCVINKKPSEHFVACVEDSLLLVSKQEMEASVNKRFPRFETLCRILSEELLAKKRGSLDDFKTSSPELRYQKLTETRPDLIQRVPQHQLASYLGITPQSLSRIRKRMTELKK